MNRLVVLLDRLGMSSGRGARQAIVPLFFLLAVTVLPSPASAATKLFSSGFEGDVALPALTWNGRQWISDLAGSDGTGSWPLTIFGAARHWAWVFNNSNSYFPVPDEGNVYLTSAYGTPNGSNTALALVLANTSDASGSARHAQYYISDTSYTGFYQKYWLKMHVPAKAGTPGWMATCGAKTSNANDINPEWLIYWAADKRPYWVMGIQHLLDSPYWWRRYDRDANNEPLHPIPDDTWFQVEYHFKYTTPVGTAPARCNMFLKVNGVTIFNEVDRLVGDANTVTRPLDRFICMTLYMDSNNLSAPAYQVIDDLEIWDDVPSGSGGAPPAAPSNLTATALSDSEIDLSWTDGADNETGFEIERKIRAGGVYSPIATVGANVTSYSDTGLLAGTSHYYRVRAYNTDGDSAYSNEADASTPGDSPIRYTARRLSSSPTIDGDLSEYAGLPELVVDVPATGTQGRYRLAWDDAALYVAGEVADTQIATAATERDAAVWNDDALELMLDTLNDGGTGQLPNADDYKFLVSAANVQNDARGGGAWATWDTAWTSSVVATGTLNVAGDTDVGWQLEAAIPWSAWGVAAPVDGERWGMDVGHDDRRDDGTVSDAAWANTDGGTVNDPAGWGELVFDGCAPTCTSLCGGEPDTCFGACPLNDGVACPDDGDACTSDVCSGGECTHPVEPTCGHDGGDVGGDADVGGDGGTLAPVAIPGCACTSAGAGTGLLLGTLGLLVRGRRRRGLA